MGDWSPGRKATRNLKVLVSWESAAVMAMIYLLFNEGYSAGADEQRNRRQQQR